MAGRGLTGWAKPLPRLSWVVGGYGNDVLRCGAKDAGDLAGPKAALTQRVDVRDADRIRIDAGPGCGASPAKCPEERANR